ncbi:GAF domain-containing sensor histidine kinase [Pedobacter jejuensis]|uniref:histidine kinase n=1 Tax=Pedobacter jejuensis TaxID=1268550 RepID=A0A3N0BW59_9SPHI|nr:GAF domain-containing sensor histidine kinase [Pedobacter jejuensis]
MVFPNNEFERLIRLSELDLDFTALEVSFEDLTRLAVKVTGTQMSLVNIIDAHTQWTLDDLGLGVKQAPRENSVCQYAIMSDMPLEISDLRIDERFTSRDFVERLDGLRYYIGIPLQLESGINIGTLCVLDSEVKSLTPEKVEILLIIAETVVERLKSMQKIQSLNASLHEAYLSKKQAAHDIRGPLSGIIGLSELINKKGMSSKVEGLLQYISMIEKSGRSLLDLTDEIMSEDNKSPVDDLELSLSLFKEKLLRLYQTQAKSKGIQFTVNVDSGNESVRFSKNKLLAIVGNLISNAIKFTPNGGIVTVTLVLALILEEKLLEIIVSDNGQGMPEKAIQQILDGKAETTSGTSGEKGYGFGLKLVKELVVSLNGQITLSSDFQRGTEFKILLSQLI